MPLELALGGAVATAILWLLLQHLRQADVVCMLRQNGSTDALPSMRARLAEHLASLSWGIAPGVFLAGVCLLGLLVSLLFLELFPDSFILAVGAGLVIALFSPRLLSDWTSWRSRRFEHKLVDAIDLIDAALSAGHGIRDALSIAATACRGPIKLELGEIATRLRLGLPISTAVQRMRTRYSSEGVRLFAQTLINRHDAAHDLALLLRGVNRVLRDRVRLRARIAGQLSGARYAAMMAASLPYLTLPVFIWKEPVWLEILTSHPHGPSFLFAAVMCQAAGFYWLQRLLRVDQ